MRIIPKALSDDTKINIQYSLIEKGKDYGLLVLCTGVYGVGSEGNSSGHYLSAMIAAGLMRWSPRYMVLDFSECDYSMSNSFGAAIMSVWKYRSTNYPIYVMTGPQSETGIQSLLAMMGHPKGLMLIANIQELG